MLLIVQQSSSLVVILNVLANNEFVPSFQSISKGFKLDNESCLFTRGPGFHGKQGVIPSSQESSVRSHFDIEVIYSGKLIQKVNMPLTRLFTFPLC